MFTPVASTDELQDGELLSCEVDGKELVLARIRDRMALETENRQLIGHRRVVTSAVDQTLERRLLALEQRVAALERQ